MACKLANSADDDIRAARGRIWLRPILKRLLVFTAIFTVVGLGPASDGTAWALPANGATSDDDLSSAHAPIGQATSSRIGTDDIGSAVVVVEDNVEVRAERDVVGRLEKGAKVTVLQVQDDWIGVSVEVDGEAKTGWVKRTEVQLWREDQTPVQEEKRDDHHAIEPGNVVEVVNDGVELKLGNEVIGELKKGATVSVDQVRDGWVGLSVEMAGQMKQGWVRTEDVAFWSESKAEEQAVAKRLPQVESSATPPRGHERPSAEANRTTYVVLAIIGIAVAAMTLACLVSEVVIRVIPAGFLRFLGWFLLILGVPLAAVWIFAGVEAVNGRVFMDNNQSRDSVVASCVVIGLPVMVLFSPGLLLLYLGVRAKRRKQRSAAVQPMMELVGLTDSLKANTMDDMTKEPKKKLSRLEAAGGALFCVILLFVIPWVVLMVSPRFFKDCPMSATDPHETVGLVTWHGTAWDRVLRVSYTFSVDGKNFTGKGRVRGTPTDRGESKVSFSKIVKVQYDPTDPTRNCISGHRSFLRFVFWVSMVLLPIGVLGCLYTIITGKELN